MRTSFRVIHAAALAALAAAEMRHAEDFRVSMIGELSGLSVAPASATISNGVPPTGLVTRRVTTRDVLGADHRLSYTAESNDDVVVLEHHDGVLGVDCGAPGRLVVRVDDVQRFFDNLPADPDTVLFVLGPGWGCKAPATTTTTDSGSGNNTDNTNAEEPQGDDAGASNSMASVEPDGETVYLRSTGVLSPVLPGEEEEEVEAGAGGLITFEVQVATIMDAFSRADISYTRTMDPEERARLERATKQAQDDAASAAAAAAAQAYGNTSSSSSPATSGRRLTFAEAYARTRVPDDHPLAAPSRGLTPHKRGLRRLAFSGRLSDESSSNCDNLILPCGPCVVWRSGRCLWGVDGQYK
jgi:hypothetical protein